MTSWITRVIGKGKEVKVQTEEEIMKEEPQDKLLRYKQEDSMMQMKRNIEYEQQRQRSNTSIAQSMAQMQTMPTNPYMPNTSSPMGVATSIPGNTGQWVTSAPGYGHTFGGPQQWKTPININDATDEDKADILWNHMRNIGLTEISLSTLHLLNKKTLEYNIKKGTMTQPKKQPKKKLDL